MSVFRKAAFYIFLVLSIGAAIWGYFSLKESKAPKTDVTEHIPATALVVIETSDVHSLIQQLTRQNLVWNSMLTEEVFSRAQKGISYLDSLTRSSEDISEILEGNPVYWSFIKEGPKNEILVQFKIKEQKDADRVGQFFKAVFVKNSSVSSFEAYDININQAKWLACYMNGIVYFCSDLSLLQKSIQLDKRASLAESEAYKRLLKLNGQQNIRVYLNHAYSTLLNKDLFNRQSLFNSDIQLNELTLTGYTMADSNSFFKVLSKQQATEFREFEKLPDGAVSITGIALGDAAVFYESVQSFLTPAVNRKNEEGWKAMNDSALYNIRAESYGNIDRELTGGNYWLENATEQMISIKVKDEEKALQLLKLMSDSAISINGLSMYKINRRCSNLFSFYGSAQEMQYGCVSSGNLVFMTSNAMLRHYTQALMNSAVLGKNLAFMSYAKDNLLQACHYLYYENYGLMKLSAFPRLINSPELNTINDALAHLSLSMKTYKNELQVRLHAMHKQETEIPEENTQVLWSFSVDSTIVTQVYTFTNHLTQENELCFQDNNNTLYLLNSTGTPLWKKEINEHIQSEVYTVDAFKNGKHQLLFNTENYLHLIDRKGKYVEGYPLKLPQKATSPITLFDYEKTKDYRIFVACADKRIYNFSLQEQKIEGFRPVKTDNIVKLPVYYARVGLSDYLITADSSGRIYAFSRRGEKRISFKNKVMEGLCCLYVLPGSNPDNTKLVFLDDKANLLHKISLSDKKETLKLGDELTGFRFRPELLNDDKQIDLVLYGDGAVYAYDLFGGKLLEFFNEQAVYRKAVFVHTESHQLILAFDHAGEKLDAIDFTGKLTFSVLRVTQEPIVTELYKDGKKYLVTVSRNKVNCTRLN